MKTFLAIIGVLAIFAVGVFAILVVIGFNTIKPLTAEATAFADEAIPAIAAEWDGDELQQRLSRELRAELTNNEIEGIMSFAAKNLGALTEYAGATCAVVNYQVTTADGELVQASCEARADHELGGAGYSLNLLKRDDEWSFLAFFIVPDQIRENDDAARMVRLETDALNIVTISVSDRAIGLTTGRATMIGADISGFEKIENIQGAE